MTIEEEVAKAIMEGGDWWEEFEERDGPGFPNWHTVAGPKSALLALSADLLRKKPRTIKINEFVIPAPVREPLEPGTRYWMVDLCFGVDVFEWCGGLTDLNWLKAGVIHLSEENAQAHYDVLVKVNNA